MPAWVTWAMQHCRTLFNQTPGASPSGSVCDSTAVSICPAVRPKTISAPSATTSTAPPHHRLTPWARSVAPSWRSASPSSAKPGPRGRNRLRNRTWPSVHSNRRTSQHGALSDT